MQEPRRNTHRMADANTKAFTHFLRGKEHSALPLPVRQLFTGISAAADAKSAYQPLFRRNPWHCRTADRTFDVIGLRRPWSCRVTGLLLTLAWCGESS